MEWCCCGSRFKEINDTTELMYRVRKPTVKDDYPVTGTITQNRPKLPKVHVTGVKTSFVSQLILCKTTPVPWLGSYGLPFPAMKSVHIFQGTDKTLKIVSFQSKPFNQVDTSINLHHVIFPDYNSKDDPGEGYFGSIKLDEIKVNGEIHSDSIQQEVIVHDQCFSPKLKPLVYAAGDESVTVSATINMPGLSQNHLYSGIEHIKMLNIILSAETLKRLNDDLQMNDIYDRIDHEISIQIQSFIEGNAHY
jgi:hypothetical protein